MKSVGECREWARLNCNFSLVSRDLVRVELRRRLAAGVQCSVEELGCANPGLMFMSLDNNPPLSPGLRLAFALATILLAMVALLANCTVLWIILRHRVMHQRTTNRLLLNLAISDLSVTFLNTILIGLSNAAEEWFLPNWICHASQMFAVTPFTASVFTMVAISVDRYFAILHPLECRPWGLNGGRCCVLTVVAIWAIAFLFGVPGFFLFDSYEDTIMVRGNEILDLSTTQCLAKKKYQDYYQIYQLSLLLLQFVLPFAILLYTYGRIARELWSSDQTPDNNLRESFLLAKRRMAKLFALLVFSFLLLWLPFQLVFVIPMDLFVGMSQFWWKVTILTSFLLAMSSTVVSPLIYYHMSERFRIGFRYAFRWLLPKSARPSTKEYREVFGLGGPRISHIFRNFPNEFGAYRRRTCDTTTTTTTGTDSAKGSIQLY